VLKLREVRGAWPLALALVAAGIAGCAAIRPVDNPDGGRLLNEGVEALEERQYLEAYERFTEVYTLHPREPLGGRAMLALAAMELDPRNPGRRLDVGAAILGRYFSGEAISSWQRPLIETTYLMALELGASEYRVEVAEAEAEQARREAAAARAAVGDDGRSLPRLPGPSVRAQADALRVERNQLVARTGELETRVAELETQLAEAQAELDRIRKTIK
jgi:hypothetical protein